jgi:mono/diheme cytochrome c family protein
VRKPTLINSLVAAASLFAASHAMAEAKPGNPKAGKTIFTTYCTVCHGNEGKGDGPGAAALNPKPRNFSDGKLMATIDDATRLKAVTEGGASVNVSPVMPPFKEAINEQQIRDVLAFVKTLAK